MPRSIRRTTIPDVLEVALELERKTMALYAEFVRLFADDPELRQFWFHMARHEAAHCGALMLVECILRNDPELGGETKILFDTSTGIRLRSLLTGYRRELRRGVTRERAFEPSTSRARSSRTSWSICCRWCRIRAGAIRPSRC
jgi:hypothetical protein